MLRVNHLIGFGKSVRLQSTGFIIAGTGVNNADAGNDAWNNPGNVTADDATSATAGGFNGTTQYLHATNFGLAVPGNAVIVGVEARVDRSANDPDFNDHTIQLIVSGSRSGDNKADVPTDWPASPANVDYGGASDLWGNTLSVAIVNASNFGLAIRGTYASSVTGSVDAVWLNVHYFA